MTSTTPDLEQPPIESAGQHKLSTVLGLTEAQDLRGKLVELLREGSIGLDASGVERISTPCVQVLLAAGVAADAANIGLKIMNATDALRDALAEFGLQSRFAGWMV